MMMCYIAILWCMAKVTKADRVMARHKAQSGYTSNAASQEISLQDWISLLHGIHRLMVMHRLHCQYDHLQEDATRKYSAIHTIWAEHASKPKLQWRVMLPCT